jgi:hypothetical protein
MAVAGEIDNQIKAGVTAGLTEEGRLAVAHIEA